MLTTAGSTIFVTSANEADNLSGEVVVFFNSSTLPFTCADEFVPKAKNAKAVKAKAAHFFRYSNIKTSPVYSIFRKFLRIVEYIK